MPVESTPNLLDPSGTAQGTAISLATAEAWWSEFGAVSDADFLTGWLKQQCDTQAGARAGIVLRPTARGLLAAASWPAKRPPAPELTRIAERAAVSVRPVTPWWRR